MCFPPDKFSAFKESAVESAAFGPRPQNGPRWKQHQGKGSAWVENVRTLHHISVSVSNCHLAWKKGSSHLKEVGGWCKKQKASCTVMFANLQLTNEFTVHTA